MADKKISDLTAITGANTADDDLLVIVDTSAGETKRITLGELENGLARSNFALDDNEKITFGAGSDLEIYSDGTNSRIKENNASGNLVIQATDISLKNSANSRFLMSAVDEGAVTLYYSNSAKLATASTGIDVTGTVTADGLTVQANTASILIRTDDPNNTELNFWTRNTADNAIFKSSLYGVVDGGLKISTADTANADAKDRISVASNGDISFYEDTGTTPKFFWDASAERLGIGGYSNRTLQVHSSGNTDVHLTNDTTGGLATDGGTITMSTAGDLLVNNREAGNLISYTSGTERMRIDSSGNLLIGTTNNTAAGGEGIALSAGSYGGYIAARRSGAACMTLDRQTDDGDILLFQKDSTTVGSIGSKTNRLYIGTGDTGLYFVPENDAVYPWNTSTNSNRDNAIDLGQSSNRFDDIYATNGTIQTSDRNEKQDIEELSEAEQRVAVACKGLLRKFRWQDAVAEKGDDARIHFGIIAQDLQDAFAAEGLDAGRYAMFINSTWTDEETGKERSRMGVRYPELLAFIIAAI